MASSTYPLVHRFDVALEAVKRVREGKSSFYMQYLLNPDTNLRDDFRTIAFAFFLISCVRIISSGVNRSSWKSFPCVFRLVFQNYVRPKRCLKFCENTWYTCWHTVSFCFGMYVLYTESMSAQQPGWTRALLVERDSKWFWFPTLAEIQIKNSKGWPFLLMSPIARTYYLTEFAFWLSCLCFLWFETFRSDFYALFLHHIVTCLLILFSYVCSFWRIGVVVLITHDIGDIILYFVKSLFYATHLSCLITPAFTLFAIVFFLSRLVFFPIFCLRPAFDTRLWRQWTQNMVKTYWDIPGGVILPSFLSVLQILHIFWFFLIVKLAIRDFYKNKEGTRPTDIRSECSSEDDAVNSPDPQHEEWKSGHPVSPTSSVSSSSSSSSDNECKQTIQFSSLPGVRAPVYDSDISTPVKSKGKPNTYDQLRRRK